MRSLHLYQGIGRARAEPALSGAKGCPKLLLAAMVFVLSSVVTMSSAATLVPPAPEILDPELKPETLAAFARYVEATEARIDQQQSRPDSFLYIDRLSEPDTRRPQAGRDLYGAHRNARWIRPRDPRSGRADPSLDR